jgi:arsenate reductase (thioredoxin)
MKKQPKTITFICVENARRSQMAQGFAEAFGQGNVEVYSAGSRPSSVIDPLVIEVMEEKGIDLSEKHPKSLNDLPPVEMDYLVTMGCEETCPAVLSKRVLEWNIPDPKGKLIAFFREVRDLIEGKVKSLLKEID